MNTVVDAHPPLAGKTVLLVAPEFFGYAADIQRTLTAWGATVHRYENRPSTRSWYKALHRLVPALARPAADRYFGQIIERHAEERIDHFLVIRGEALSPSLIERFAAAFPAARRVLYLWDSLAHDPAARNRIAHFQEAYTFDPDDAASDPRLRLLPLFFRSGFAELRARPADLGLSFVGTVHADRYPIIRALRKSLPPSLRTLFFMYFPSRTLFWFRRLFDARLRGSRKSEFAFEPMPAAKVAETFARSAAILDIQRETQSGLTIRTLESLGAQRKLLTTNSAIRRYDFYDPDNIAVIDRNSPGVPADFFRQRFRPTPPEVLERYAVEHFLRTLLGLVPLAEYLRPS